MVRARRERIAKEIAKRIETPKVEDILGRWDGNSGLRSSLNFLFIFSQPLRSLPTQCRLPLFQSSSPSLLSPSASSMPRSQAPSPPFLSPPRPSLTPMALYVFQLPRSRTFMPILIYSLIKSTQTLVSSVVPSTVTTSATRRPRAQIHSAKPLSSTVSKVYAFRYKTPPSSDERLQTSVSGALLNPTRPSATPRARWLLGAPSLAVALV